MRYVIQISDPVGTACRIRLNLPFLVETGRPDNSSWQVLDEGALNRRSGGCHASWDWGESSTSIALCVAGRWYLKVWNMFDGWDLVNYSGTGISLQWIVLSLQPGFFTWALIE
jgi:hypothetical protein